MPEIKQSFLQGKMNKDLDERIVPKGEYRDALNIEVSTSDASDIGTVQSVAGNQQINPIPGLNNEFSGLGYGATCVGSVTDPKNDKIYWLINSDSLPATGMTEETRDIWHDKDIIVEYDAHNKITVPILVDIYQVWISLNANNISIAPATNDLSVSSGTQGVLPGMIAEGLNANGEIIYSSVVTSVALFNIIFEDNINAFTFEGNSYNFFDLHSFRFKNDFGRVLKFNKDNIITGINILDDMLLWTDNESEPKKINITRSKFGSTTIVNDVVDMNLGTTNTFAAAGFNVISSKIVTWSNLGTPAPQSVNYIANVTPSLITGEVYRLTLEISNYSGTGDVGASTSGGISINARRTSNGTYTEDFTADGMSIKLFARDTNSATIKFNVVQLPILYQATTESYNTHTKLAITDQLSGELITGQSGSNYDLIQEDHITVIRKYPMAAPVLEMKNTIRSGNIKVSIKNIEDVTAIPTTEICPVGINPEIGTIFEYDANGGDALITEDLTQDFEVGDIVKISTYVNNILIEGRLRITNITIDDVSNQNPNQGPQDVVYISCVLLSISDNVTDNDINWQMELEQEDAMFEFKFPRFAYRYKYEDGEYSTMSPFSEVAFLPEGGDFDYLPKKGYNLSMVNSVRHLAIKDFVLGDNLQGSSIWGANKNPLPTDVASIDILYKESNSPNVYTVKTIKRKHDEFNAINSNGDPATLSRTRGYLNITSEMIHNVLPSNQLLRAWDNVPRKALAQEISGNRLIYGNYLQGYNVDADMGNVLRVNVISKSLASKVYPEQMDGNNVYSYYPAKSLKSLRTYQLGVVYRDKYGRETPVLTGNKVDSSISLDKYYSDKQSQFKVNLVGTLPDWVDSYKFFVKETSNEYYNVAMDRWYDADDGNVWISFPSSERNKIDEDSYLILKKKHDQDEVVIEAPAKYKVISIKNEAPDFIKLKSMTTGTARESTINGLALGDLLGASNHLNFPLAQRKVFTLNASGQGVQLLVDKYVGKTINNLQVRFNNDNIFTRWYEVTTIDLTGSSNDLEITLKKPLTSDVNILTSGGVDSTTKYNNRYKTAKINAQFAEKHSQNRPEFDGRFFVKIHRDSILAKNILIEPNTDFAENTSYHITEAHTVHYIDANTDWARGNGLELHNSGVAGIGGSNPWDGFGVTTDQINHYSKNLIASGRNWATPMDPNWLDIPGGKTFWKNFSDQNYHANSPPFSNTMFIDGNSAFQYLCREHVSTSSSYGEPATKMKLGWGREKLGDMPNDDWYIPPIENDDEYYTSLAPVTNTTTNYGNLSFPYANPGQGGIGSYTGGSLWNASATAAAAQAIATAAGYSAIAGEHVAGNSSTDSFGEWLFHISRHSDAPTIKDYYGLPTPLNTNLAIGYFDSGHTRDKESRGIENNFTHLSWSGIRGGSGTNGSSSNLKLRDNSHDYGEVIDFWDLLAENGTLWRWEEDPDQRIYRTTNHSGTSFQPLFNTAFWHHHRDLNVMTTRWVFFPEGFFTLDANQPWNKRNRAGFYFEDYITGGAVGGGPSMYKPTNDPTLPAHFDSDGLVLSSLPTDINTGQVLPAPGIRSDGMGTGTTTATAGVVPSGGLRQQHGNTDNDSIPGSVTWTILTPVSEQEDIKYASHNPAIFETEPKEDVDLDIYHEIGQIYPVELNERTSELYIPIGSKVRIWRPKLPWINTPTIETGNISNFEIRVAGFDYSKSPRENTIKIILEDEDGNLINTFFPGGNILPGDHLSFARPDGSSTSAVVYWEDWTNVAPGFFQTVFTNLLATGTYMLSTDIHDRSQRLPWFNCYSFGNGVESDRIRDDYNAITIDNGPKVSSIIEGTYEEERKNSTLIYSDLYNSISGVNNLNQFIQAEKITKDINPIYGSIQKLHARDTDLITICEDKVLKILVDKHAIFNADGNPQLIATRGVLGQTIPFSGDFGISKNPESFTAKGFRAYFTDKNRGTVLRLSKDGLTVISEYGMKDWFADNLINNNKLIGSYNDKKDLYNITLSEINKTVSFSERVKGWPSFKSFVPEQGVSLNNNYYTFKNGDIWKHHITNNYGYPVKRNNFYDIQYTSSIEFLLNTSPEIVKNFNTLSYEGSESKIMFDWEDSNHYNNVTRDGWFCEKIETDLQSGDTLEFKGKEGKWFAEIKGETTTLANLDTEEFSVQGIGNCNDTIIELEAACISPSVTINYAIDTTIDVGDGSMVLGGVNITASVTPPLDENNVTICDGLTLQFLDDDLADFGGPAIVSSNSIGPVSFEPLFLPGNYNVRVTDCDGCITTLPFSIMHDGTTVGCMVSGSFNYDPNAVYEPTPSPCVACIYGCMDSWAISGYNPLATCNCAPAVPGVYNGIGVGCISCTYATFGCMDSNANNHNPIATVDDGTCTYDTTYDCVRGSCRIHSTGLGYWTDANYYSTANGYPNVDHGNIGQTCMAYCVCGPISSLAAGGFGWEVNYMTTDTGTCMNPNNDGEIDGDVNLTNYVNAIPGFSRWKVQLWASEEFNILLDETPYGGTGATPPANGWDPSSSISPIGSFNFPRLSPCNSYALRLIIENTMDVTQGTYDLQCHDNLLNNDIAAASGSCNPCGANDGVQPLAPASTNIIGSNLLTSFTIGGWYSDPAPLAYNNAGIGKIATPGSWVINWDSLVNSGTVNLNNTGVSGWNTGPFPNVHGTYDLGMSNMNGPGAAYHISDDTAGYLIQDLPERMQAGETYHLEISTVIADHLEYTDDLYWVIGYDASGNEIAGAGGFSYGSGLGDPLDQDSISGVLYHKAIVTMPAVLNDENGNPGMDKLMIFEDGEMFGGIQNVTLTRCPNTPASGNPNYDNCTSCTSCA